MKVTFGQQTTKVKQLADLLSQEISMGKMCIRYSGTPNTAHSLNPVPFVYVTENKNAKVENGVLADVAPSILHGRHYRGRCV